MRKLIAVFLLLVLSGQVRAETFEAPGTESFVMVTSEKLRRLETLHDEAQRLIAVGSLREAMALFWEIILTEPDDDAAYTNLGHLYLILGDNGRAKDAFQNALHINPENEAAMAGFMKITRPDEYPE